MFPELADALNATIDCLDAVVAGDQAGAEAALARARASQAKLVHLTGQAAFPHPHETRTTPAGGPPLS